MKIEKLSIENYQEVWRCRDAATGLHALIAVHNTVLGPALGGTRLYPYANEEAALEDVLRLARGMTYKSALAGLGLGGGKSVIIADPSQKTPALFEAFGEFVDSLEGRYICAEDVNTSPEDMEIVHRKTNHVGGLKESSGDPSPATALGVFVCIEEVAENHLRKKLSDVTVMVQGVGHVGALLVDDLVKVGARVKIADVDKAHLDTVTAKHPGIQIIAPDDVYKESADIFAPCAMGAILNDKTIPILAAKAVVGSANNQLGELRHAEMMAARGILYAPDYLVNAGGIIDVGASFALGGYDHEAAMAAVKKIRQTLQQIFILAAENGVTTAVAADQLAEMRFRPLDAA